MKNSYDTIGNRTHHLPACSALPHVNTGSCYVFPSYYSQVYKPALDVLSTSAAPLIKQTSCAIGPIKIFLISTFYDTVELSLLYQQKCLTKCATKDGLFYTHSLNHQFRLNNV